MIPSLTAIVPMRGGSERVPGKNIRDFGGLPLYHHIVRTLLSVPELSRVVVDSDSDAILADVAEHFPTVHRIRRPDALGEGTVSMNAVLKHVIDRLDGQWFLQTHSTNPLLTPASVSRAIQALFQSRDDGDDVDSLFTVTPWHTRFWAEDGSAINHDPNVLLRTQDLPAMLEENSCMYLFSRQTLVDRGNRIGHRPMLYPLERLEALDIDDEADFLIAEQIFALRRDGKL